MQLEVRLGKDDGWFASLPQQRQARYLAFLKVEADPTGERYREQAEAPKDRRAAFRAQWRAAMANQATG